MALTVALGKSLFSLGVGVSDLALVANNGRKLGNWIYAKMHDKELFDDILCEDMEALLKRKGLVDKATMDRRWSKQLNVVANGRRINGRDLAASEDSGYLDRITWLMSAVITAIDLCLMTRDVEEVVVDTFLTILRPDESPTLSHDLRYALKMQIGTNIHGWRSVGVVRSMVQTASRAFSSALIKVLDAEGEAMGIPLMNPSEKTELKRFLAWLMGGTNEQNLFNTESALVYGVARSISEVGIRLNCTGMPAFEADPTIRYIGDGDIIFGPDSNFRKTSYFPPQQISFPLGRPEQMIEALPVSRRTKEQMKKWWSLGAEAAKKSRLLMFNKYPMTRDNIFPLTYHTGFPDRLESSFDHKTMHIASNYFPEDSEQLLATLEKFLHELPHDIVDFLLKQSQIHVEALRPFATPVDPDQRQTDATYTLQALIFGYYFALLEPWVCLDFCPPQTYFRSSWGSLDQLLIQRCSMFARRCRTFVGSLGAGVTRVELLWILSIMFTGNLSNRLYGNEPYDDGRRNDRVRPEIVAIVSNISIFSASLVRPSDTPESIGQFIITPLPVLNLLTSQHGQLYSANIKSSMEFHPLDSQLATRSINFENPKKKWKVLPRLVADEDGTLNSVTMVARCDGRVVGTFSPFKADKAIVWASQCPHTECPMRKETDSETTIDVVMVTEDHFIDGSVCFPSSDKTPPVVQSCGNSTMRYAATGLYDGDDIYDIYIAPKSMDCLAKIRDKRVSDVDSKPFVVIL